MKLFLLRHGMTARAETDAERMVTPDGIEDIKRVMARRKDELANVVQVYSSPLERVRQTARIAGEVIGYQGTVLDNQALFKLTRGEEIAASLADVDLTKGDLLLVSHESSLCNLMLWLAGEDILMSNSSLTALETNELALGKGKLLWQESPNGSQIKRTVTFVDQF